MAGTDLKGHGVIRAAKTANWTQVLQAAEKLTRAVGPGFSPDIKPIKSKGFSP
jgi:hypothetical protein